MHRAKVAYRPEARADLQKIFRYVANVSQSQAVAAEFVNRIMARCRKIGDVPYGGRPRDDLEPGLRTVPFERRAVIAYKIDDDLVRILNVFYGGQDYKALYHGDHDSDAEGTL